MAHPVALQKKSYVVLLSALVDSRFLITEFRHCRIFVLHYRVIFVNVYTECYRVYANISD